MAYIIAFLQIKNAMKSNNERGEHVHMNVCTSVQIK
jgi:hypothetical protein